MGRHEWAESVCAKVGGAAHRRWPPSLVDDWYDAFRHKACEVASIAAESTRRGGISGNALLIGDSATAYCVDRAFDAGWGKLQREIMKRARSAKILRATSSSR